MTDRIFVDGSTSSESYLAVALKGNLVLSVKPNVIADGNTVGVPGVTYFGAKLRSAHAPGSLVESHKPEGTVAFANLAPSHKWNEIDWEKVDESRASGQVGVFLKGTFSADPDKLLSNFAEGKLMKEFAAFLFKCAEGPGVVYLTDQAELSAWLDEKYAPQVNEIAQKATEHKAVAKAIEASTGVFSTQTALLKKLYKDSAPEAVPSVVKGILATAEYADMKGKKLEFKPKSKPSDDEGNDNGEYSDHE